MDKRRAITLLNEAKQLIKGDETTYVCIALNRARLNRHGIGFLTPTNTRFDKPCYDLRNWIDQQLTSEDISVSTFFNYLQLPKRNLPLLSEDALVNYKMMWIDLMITYLKTQEFDIHYNPAQIIRTQIIADLTKANHILDVLESASKMVEASQYDYSCNAVSACKDQQGATLDTVVAANAILSWIVSQLKYLTFPSWLLEGEEYRISKMRRARILWINKMAQTVREHPTTFSAMKVATMYREELLAEYNK